jgi:hypothetical protein
LPGIASSVKQHHEHHQADRKIAANDKMAERFDDLAGRIGAGVAVHQHNAG